MSTATGMQFAMTAVQAAFDLLNNRDERFRIPDNWAEDPDFPIHFAPMDRDVEEACTDRFVHGDFPVEMSEGVEFMFMSIHGETPAQKIPRHDMAAVVLNDETFRNHKYGMHLIGASKRKSEEVGWVHLPPDQRIAIPRNTFHAFSGSKRSPLILLTAIYPAMKLEALGLGNKVNRKHLH